MCPCCKSAVNAKCGDVKINHWAHIGKRKCESWWENETKWHRQWKNHFPEYWQEIVHSDETGEKHIADVKTKKDWVLEFQHSYITPEERNSRNTFYSKLVWIIDGLRRKTDRMQFQKILEESSRAPIGNLNIRKISFPEESRLLKEWFDCGVPVFFDFGQTGLWFLLPFDIKDEAYLIHFSREEFIKVHNNEGFNELINEIIPNIQNMISGFRRKIDNMSVNKLLNPKRRTTRRRRF
uniref:competence protein CoiA n=1 Tax=Echinicola strongylocentroti TaxID=1795355 RepID=UPI0021D25107|nr:competence protein CoiA family protein [Echinicola strongylocentroti]